MPVCPHCEFEMNAPIKSSTSQQLIACDRCLNPSLVTILEDSNEASALENEPAVEEMAPEGSVMAGLLQALKESVSQLPVLPHVPQRVLALIHDPIASMNDVAKIIHDDPALGMKIMRVSNSALYGGVSEIKDLQVACARLGMKTVANVVSTTAAANLFRAKNPSIKILMEALWKHSVVTAYCAERLGAEKPGIHQRSTFLAGLVHDIGKLVLLDLIDGKYTGHLGRMRESPSLMFSVTERFASIAGLLVVQYWQLPAEFSFSTYFNPRPDSLPVNDWKTLTHLVALASSMASEAGFPFDPNWHSPILHGSRTALGISTERIAELSTRVQDDASVMFETFAA